MSLALVTARTLQPIDLAAAKLQARVDGTDEDALITALIVAAADEAEAIMQRAILPQTWRVTADCFGQRPLGVGTPWFGDSAQLGASAPVYGTSYGLLLQRPTVTAVTSIKYVAEADGVLTTLDPSQYQLLVGNEFTARVVPAFGCTWPTTRAQPEAVQVDFVCGWPTVLAVPEGIKQWVCMRVKDLYDNRGAWSSGKKVEVNPFVDFMLDRYLAKSF